MTTAEVGGGGGGPVPLGTATWAEAPGRSSVAATPTVERRSLAENMAVKV